MVELHGYKVFVSIGHPYPFVFPQGGMAPMAPPKYVPVTRFKRTRECYEQWFRNCSGTRS